MREYEIAQRAKLLSPNPRYQPLDSVDFTLSQAVDQLAVGSFNYFAVPSADTLQHLALDGSVVGSINHVANSYDLVAPGAGAGVLIDGANSLVSITGSLVVGSQTPASAAAAGVAGTIAWDSSYIYVCVATNTWKRVAIATW